MVTLVVRNEKQRKDLLVSFVVTAEHQKKSSELRLNLQSLVGLKQAALPDQSN